MASGGSGDGALGTGLAFCCGFASPPVWPAWKRAGSFFGRGGGWEWSGHAGAGCGDGATPCGGDGGGGGGGGGVNGGCWIGGGNGGGGGGPVKCPGVVAVDLKGAAVVASLGISSAQLQKPRLAWVRCCCDSRHQIAGESAIGPSACKDWLVPASSGLGPPPAYGKAASAAARPEAEEVA